MSVSDEVSLVKIPTFSGLEKGKWREWRAKFWARASLQEWTEVLTSDAEVPADEERLEDVSNVADREKKLKIKKANSKAYNHLLLALTDTAFLVVEDASRTEKLPNGSAAAAWRILNEKYEAKTAVMKVELKQEFASSTLLRGQDPDEWMVELEHIRSRLRGMGARMEDDDVIAHVLTHLTAEYSELVTVLEGDIAGLTVTVLKERIRAFFRRKQLGESGKADGSDARALVHDARNGGRNDSRSGTGGERFQGDCYICGKSGHKAANCKSGGGDGENCFRGKCFYCHKVGHRVTECKKKRADQGRGNGGT
ncbi:unnamed protein product, partial [Chrysoparadoxa australica]